MSSGKPVRDMSIRPQASLPEEHGGCSIAEGEQIGIRAECELLRLRQDQQDTADLNGVDDDEKVEEEEELIAPDEK